MPSEILELAESVLVGSATSGTGLDTALWKALDETGLARLTLPEAAGGSEASFADSAEVLQAAGAHAARVPLVETDLLAGWLLHAHGLAVPDGPLTAVAGDLAVDGTAVRGELVRVPWARGAGAVVVLTPTHVVLLPVDGLTVTEGTNLAEEPRDRVVVDVADATLAPVVAGAAAELRLRAALGRAQLLAGAARGAVARTVQYAGERVQFGRPIGRFQAVQQQLALAAAEVAAAGAAASAAAAEVDRAGFGDPATAFAVAAAKARTGEAAGEVARVAHQVHGAIGFTREHDLRLLTTRLWAWRDEDGSDAQWQAELGATVLAAGADALWPMVTGTP
ncbi:acyl-CoA dehydrogenase family protein [Pseudonocardia broussonetiae]|uniref:Acyl-CoA dehydrogenase n=1 Tax=Pseudonocardia broussonetiae TaxID=2736640 RepID=A0A6M6JMM3_9PSEU|nr:acyl-CoA dehydrogenase family protein [Pseudonocardia broussonetiae]QJY48585.1 acyl-CoA dehydrogenase [Pseudonocardia broussonetiae]